MKLIQLLGCLSAALISMQSCNKADTTTEDIPVTLSEQTINATVEKNQTYRLVLPSSVSGYYITSNSAHSTVSKVVTESGNEIYEYTPTDNYVGSDALVIEGSDTTGVGGEGGCNKEGRGKRPNGSESQQQIRQQRLNINITVTDPATTS